MPDHQVTSEILDRLPPQNLSAEKGVLGSLLIDPKLCDDVAEVVGADDFYADANQRLYRHLLEMHHNGGRIDMLLLRDRLTAAGDYETVGGGAYLAEVAQAAPVAHNAVYYARIVSKAAKLRAIIHAATGLLRDAYEPGGEPTELLNQAEAAMAAIHADEVGVGPRDATDVAMDAFLAIQQIGERKQGFGVATGLEKFDEHFGGLFPGELCILAARPGVGKTSLAVQIADHNGEKGRMTYYASLEMSAVELAIKTICGLAGVNGKLIRTGQIGPEESKRLAEAVNVYSTRSVVLDARPRLTVYDLRRAARRLVRRGLRLIVIDYLQLITPQDRRIQRNEQVGQMTAGLKELAREMNVPVLCLCQLNREAEKQDFPTLANLRESGNIEQDADVVLMLSRPEGGIKDRETGDVYDAQLRIAKNRNGETGVVRLTWDKYRTRFGEPVRQGYDEFNQFGE